MLEEEGNRMSSDLLLRLQRDRDLPDRDWTTLLREGAPNLAALADQKRRAVYGNKVFIRGLIEFTNI